MDEDVEVTLDTNNHEIRDHVLKMAIGAVVVVVVTQVSESMIASLKKRRQAKKSETTE